MLSITIAHFLCIPVIDIVNSGLKALQPPKSVHRMLRSICEIVYWKASEIKLWFFYCSLPILQGIMRPDYYDHYILLVTGVAILSSDRITDHMIDVARDLLNRYVREFEILYGPQFCSINLHHLLHLPDTMRQLGPLFAHTCYEYEDLNGQMLKLVHGTTHIDTQISKSHQQFNSMIKLIEPLEAGKIRDFCLQKKKQVKILERVSINAHSVGTYKPLLEIPEIVENLLHDYNGEHNSVWQYLRLLKTGKLYVSEMYTRALQTTSSVIMYCEHDQLKFGKIQYFIKVMNCDCMQAICECHYESHYAIIQEIISDNVLNGHGDQHMCSTEAFLREVHCTNLLKAVSIIDLITVCFYMTVAEAEPYCVREYIAIPINKIELE